MNIILPDDINRASTPLFLVIMIILSYINNISYYYSLGIIASSNINKLIKKYIYKPLMGDKDIPILGKGTRPIGAKNCRYFRDNFLDSTIKPKPVNSYGMPSGHSQSAAFYLSFIYQHFRNQPLIFYPSLLYSLYIPYTRVKFKCHTYQQVIVGFISGLIFYRIYVYLYKTFIDKYINKYIIKTSHEEIPQTGIEPVTN
tara:strand:- start:242 stop:838 length:597 start_codon:yes stop_codon:yes gene_type:complete